MDVLYIWFAMREEDVLAGYTLSGGSPDNLGSACCSRTIALVLRIAKNVHPIWEVAHIGTRKEGAVLYLNGALVQ